MIQGTKIISLEIHLLKSELKGVSELRDMCTALTNEVSALCKALEEMKHTSEAAAVNNPSANGYRWPAPICNARRNMPKTYAQATLLGTETGMQRPPGTSKKKTGTPSTQESILALFILAYKM